MTTALFKELVFDFVKNIEKTIDYTIYNDDFNKRAPLKKTGSIKAPLKKAPLKKSTSESNYNNSGSNNGDNGYRWAPGDSGGGRRKTKVKRKTHKRRRTTRRR